MGLAGNALRPTFWDALSAEEIERRLRDAPIRGQDREPGGEGFSIGVTPKPAAVLMPLLRREGGWHLLFTRRVDGLPEHGGQVSFPGGRADSEDESPLQTALREAEEEIGLAPIAVRILGQMPPQLTITNYLVTPFVGAVPWPYPWRIATQEVSRIFTIPLEWLSRKENYQREWRALPDGSLVEVISYHPYEGEVLWGFSARLTQQLLRLLSDEAEA